MADLLFKLATRSRPDRFMPVLDRAYAYLSGRHRCRFIISADADDRTMNNEAMRAYIASKPGAEIHFNPPPQTKISASNSNIRDDDWDVLVNLADDMVPLVYSFDDVIASDMEMLFPNLDGCLWYPDGQNPRLCTISILGRRYYDAIGFIYHPDFVSLFADDYHHLLAMSLKKLAHTGTRLIHHAWTQWTGTDDLYHRNTSAAIKDRDRQTFERLKREDLAERIARVRPMLTQP